MIASLQTPLKQMDGAYLLGFRLDVDFLSDPTVNHLQWLQAQNTLPRFYWQSRDGDLEIAAAGAAKTFSSLAAAQQFIGRCAATEFQPLLVGGLPFPQADFHLQDDKQFQDDNQLQAAYQFQDDNQLQEKTGFSSSSASESGGFFFLPEQSLIRRGKHTFLVRFVNNSSPAAADSNSFAPACKAGFTGGLSQTILNGEKFPLLYSRQDSPDRQQWTELVNKVLLPQALAKTPKIVLARRSTFQLRQKLNEYALLQRWHQVEPETIPFLLQVNADSCFFGCTPERLYRRQGREFSSEALAGTVRKSSATQTQPASASRLRSDVKIRREYHLVQEYIERQLLPLCEGIQVEPVADVVGLRHIQHLRKLITGHLKATVADAALLQALHPTPAVGGSPRQESIQFINTQEYFKRGWYAGAIGYMSAEEAEFSVAIRSARKCGQQIEFYAGAGIVAGSEATAEWQELDNKIETVLRLFEQVQPGQPG